jgi:hypothetical protein
MRRHARQLADRVDAAETTSSCAWFCAWSSSQSSSPRTSSSISLSSPYCPPSHKRWRSSEQCSRESTALHSDYYSTMRKTATPLNESWTAEAAALLAAPTAPALATRRAACSWRSLHARREISSCAKIPVPQRFSIRLPICVTRAGTVAHRRTRTRQRRAGTVLGGFFAPKKIFAPSRSKPESTEKFRSRTSNRLG